MAHIARFLKDIDFHKKTGHLDFRRSDVQKHLYFQEGNLIFVKTNIPGERLGEILFKTGRISEDVYRLIPTLIQPDAMLGEILIQKKLISQQALYDGLVAQMTSVTLGLFAIVDAEISFRERGRFVEGNLGQKIRLPELIAKGVRGMPNDEALFRLYETQVPVPARDENKGLLTEDEKQVLDRVDGIADAATLAAGDRPDEAWKTLYLLDCLGLVEMRAPEHAPPAADIRRRLDEAAELRKKLPGLESHQILGVPSYADEAEVKKAYFKLARKFHPDLFGRHLAPDEKRQVDEVFDAVTKAYRVMTHKDPRRVPEAKSGSEAVDKDRSKTAETRFRQGKTLFQRGRFDEAAALLEEAVTLKDDKADYFLLLAMAQSKLPALSKKAERNFMRTIKLEPWNPEGPVGLGILYKQEGLVARARKQFEKALEIDSEHPVARKELGLRTTKADEKKGLKGILTKDLFGSKKK